MGKVYDEGGYNGNPRLKRDGFEHPFTMKEIQEYQRCMLDIEHFCENYIKVIQLGKGIVPFKLRDYQRRMIKESHENRFSIVLSGRQSGKCPAFDTYITVRNKSTGFVEKIQIGKLYERIRGGDTNKVDM